MNVVAEIQRLNERELELNVPLSGSWHQKYSESAWAFIGGLPFELSEGDVLCVLSQFGEIEDIHLVRDGKTGKSKGFAFIKYEDQRSTILAVDNLNGFKLLDRVLRVDHVLKYKLPKELQEDSDSEEEDGGKERKQRGLPGHAYEGKELATDFDLQKGVDVFAAPEETHKEKKKRRRDEKKAKKTAKKMKKIEKKQQKIFEQVQKRRQEQRLKEEREAVQKEDDFEVKPSATGWRGRMEPSAPQPRRDGDRKQADARREKQQDKSYGVVFDVHISITECFVVSPTYDALTKCCYDSHRFPKQGATFHLRELEIQVPLQWVFVLEKRTTPRIARYSATISAVRILKGEPTIAMGRSLF